MTAPVNRASAASAIAALLRQAVGAHAQPSMRRAGGTSASSGKAAAPGRGGNSKIGGGDKRHGDAKSLGDLIAARAEGLAPDASDYRSRLLRLVIEASLLHQFGSNLMNAPKFQSMVDQILHELESAPQLKRDVDAVLNGLSSHPSSHPFSNQTFTR